MHCDLNGIDMMNCPPPDKLADLLAERATPVELDTLNSHVRDCNHCSTILDQLTDDRDLRSWRPEKRQAGSPDSLPFDEPKRDGDLASFGTYRILKLLGRGGMGLVYLAFDETLSRNVALKFLRPEFDLPEIRDRFIREGRVAAGIRHDHVVIVFSVSQNNGELPYLAMEYLGGESLAERIDGKPMPIREAVKVIIQVADGLAAAHKSGLIHRDIKPANILFESGTGRAKIVDFGLARTENVLAGLTQDGTVVGTPHYLSPEQADPRNVKIDARADQYSLGATLYEALTGTTPFHGTSLGVLHQVLNESPPTPRTLNRDIPHDLETICLKAMARERDRRYLTILAFRDDLQRWLNGEPILARPAGRIERSYRWMARNPLPVSLIAAILIGLIASLAGWRHASDQAEKAREKSRLADARSGIALGSVAVLVEQAQKIQGNDSKSLAIQRTLNAAALNELKKLADEIDRNPDPDAGIAEAQYRLGESYYSLGKLSESEAYFRKSFELSQQLARREAAEIRHVLNQSKAAVRLGRMALYRGDYQTAKSVFSDNVKLIQHNLKSKKDIALNRELAMSFNALGDVGFLGGPILEGISNYQKAESIIEELLSQESNHPGYLADARFTQARLAQCFASRLRFDEALKYQIQAERSAAAFLAVATDRLAAERDVRVSRLDRLQLLVRACLWTDAEPMAREVISECEKAAAVQPDDAILRRDVAVGQNLLAVTLNGLGRFDDALLAAEKSFKLRKGFPLVEQIEVCWIGANTAARAGKFLESAQWCDRAIAAIQEAQKLNQATPAQVAERGQFELYAKAARFVPMRLQPQNRMDAIPADVAQLVHGMSGVYFVRINRFNDAIQVLSNLPETSDLEVQKQRILIAIMLGESSIDQELKNKYRQLGKDGLMSLARRYPAVLSVLYLFPELTAVCRSPEWKQFQNELVP